MKQPMQAGVLVCLGLGLAGGCGLILGLPDEASVASSDGGGGSGGGPGGAPPTGPGPDAGPSPEAGGGGAGGGSVEAKGYDFEAGSTQGWTIDCGTYLDEVVASSERAFTATHALAMRFSESAAGIPCGQQPLKHAALVKEPPMPVGVPVKFRLWVPEDAPIHSVQVYFTNAEGDWDELDQTNADFRLYEGDDLNHDDWTELTIKTDHIEWIEPVELGIQIWLTAPWSGTCYLDAVTW